MRSEEEIRDELEMMEEMVDGSNRFVTLMLQSKITQLKWVLNDEE